MKTVTLYSKKDCLGCFATEMTLESQKTKYETIKVDEDREGLELIKSLGFRAVPVVVVREGPDIVSSWSGFRPDRLSELQNIT